MVAMLVGAALLAMHWMRPETVQVRNDNIESSTKCFCPLAAIIVAKYTLCEY